MERETPRIEVSVPRNRNPRCPHVRIHRRRLEPGDITSKAGIPVTSPARTLIDLAARLPYRRLEAAINAADKLDLIDPESMRTDLEGRRHEHGLPALRHLLDRDRFVLTDSELERRFLPIARRAGLPKPSTGERIQGYRVDFHWPELGLVVETDGLRYHRTAAQQSRDRRRDQTLTAAGLTVLRFTHQQVSREPAEVERTLRAIARRRRYLAV
jgi:very-short-patch-repair endonuclease